MHSTVNATLSRRGLFRLAVCAAATIAAGCTRTTPTPTSRPTTAVHTRVHRILTCNILLDLPEQKGTPFDWAAQRREACFNLIRSRHPDIVCMQEVGLVQNDDLVKAFPEFASFGYHDPYVDTRPKRFQAIKNVILYSTTRYDLVSAGTYWLSATPATPGSRLPDEGQARHVTWVRLKDRATGRQFRVLDTHWGLKQPTRQQQARILAAESQSFPADLPQLLCGDFNSTASSTEHQILLDAGWKDTYAAAPATTPTTPVPRKIDFILYRGPIKPLSADSFRTPEPHHPASDHPFVSADVAF